MPKQEYELIDYLAAPILGVVFFAILLILCVIINFTLITKRDDLTSLEKIGARHNLRLGPHSMAVIRRGGYASTLAEEEDMIKK